MDGWAGKDGDKLLSLEPALDFQATAENGVSKNLKECYPAWTLEILERVFQNSVDRPAFTKGGSDE